MQSLPPKLWRLFGFIGHCSLRNDKMLPMSIGQHQSDSGPYKLETVSRACSLLKAFSDEQEALTLAEIAKRTGCERTITFRLIRTLEQAGFLHKTEGLRYTRRICLLDEKRYRVGYASQTESSSFVSAVSESIRWAATQHQVELVVFDNRYSPQTALRNAERMVKEKVDLAIEFQAYDRIASKLSSLFQQAGIPLIAIEVPHPGANFFGIDNYRVGMLAGRTLSSAAKKYWHGEADEILFLEMEIAGPVPRLRLSGAESAIRESLPAIERIHRFDTRGEFLRSFDAIRKYLRRTPERKSLITGVNDSAVLGAIRAFEEAGRHNLCLAVGLGGLPEARRELRTPGTRLIGSVGFFPEQYGAGVMQLALRILNRKDPPPVVHASAHMITSQDVDHYYPHDLYEAPWSYA
jgi:ribose transport system substrate-binding protein